MNARFPAYMILTVVALVSAGLLLLNTWFRTLWLLGLAAGAWFVLSILVGGLYPGFVQRFQVEPNELNVERAYLRNHLEATRAAFDLDAIETRRFTGEQEPSRRSSTRTGHDQQPAPVGLPAAADDVRAAADPAALLPLRGRRHRPLPDRRRAARDHAQRTRAGRRAVGHEPRPGPRRLVYTHGYGITAVPVDAVTSAGTPDYLVSGINREPELPITEPRIYFGEETDTYIVTSTTTPSSTTRSTPTRTARPGPRPFGRGRPVSTSATSFNRLLFTLRFADFNLLISGQLTDESQILFRRRHRGAGPRDRAIPCLRPRPVSRQRGRPARLGMGRVHRHRSLPERAAAGRQPLRGRELRA